MAAEGGLWILGFSCPWSFVACHEHNVWKSGWCSWAPFLFQTFPAAESDTGDTSVRTHGVFIARGYFGLWFCIFSVKTTLQRHRVIPENSLRASPGVSDAVGWYGAELQVLWAPSGLIIALVAAKCFGAVTRQIILMPLILLLMLPFQNTGVALTVTVWCW